LGVGIDYALFVVTRHRQHLAAGVPVRRAVAYSMASSGSAVLFAGGTVVIALGGSEATTALITRSSSPRSSSNEHGWTIVLESNEDG
jgi:uncharacterized membrane protein YdfJ with MMPL/SSD domain